MNFGAEGGTHRPNSVDRKAQAALIDCLERGSAIVESERVADRAIELGIAREIEKNELPSGNFKLRKRN